MQEIATTKQSRQKIQKKNHALSVFKLWIRRCKGVIKAEAR